MSQKRARAARQSAASASPAAARLSWRTLAIACGVLLVLVGSFTIPKLRGGSSSAVHAGMAEGTGPMVGTTLRFNERDVLTGKPISSQTLRGHRALLFFSEGVMCQACLQQIHDIDDVAAQLASRHVELISITPDGSADLRQAIGQYGIRSPMISDSNLDMSRAFNMLGRGMHGNTPGHAFVLIDGTGKVLWQRDYYQAPWRPMYVEPAELLKDVPA